MGAEMVVIALGARTSLGRVLDAQCAMAGTRGGVARAWVF